MNEIEYSTFVNGFGEELPTEDTGELQTLYTLSKSIRDILVPVRATAFKASLRQRMETRTHAKSRFQIFARRQNVIWMAVAAAGSLLSITGVVLILVKRLKTSTNTDQPAAAAPI